MGGQGMSPYEQKTQQSPFWGFDTAPQFEHSQKYWQESVGISSVDCSPHFGHVIVD